MKSAGNGWPHHACGTTITARDRGGERILQATVDNVLPGSHRVPVNALARLFENTTTSYKYVFFLGLLEALKENSFSTVDLSVRHLAEAMVARAWYPVTMFHLSLGHQDQIAALIQAMPDLGESPLPRSRLRRAISQILDDHHRIVRYVPYRLLAPFFAEQLRGLPDHSKHELIRTLAHSEFQAKKPLFRFKDDETFEVHPAWMEYLSHNLPIVAGWAELHWISYLEDRNPTVPALSQKAGPPKQRKPLTSQVRHWKAILASLGNGARCVYSHRPLEKDLFHLDHFLPWTFVCHDALWNLLPVMPEANASKGNQLPDPSYLPSVSDLHFRALSCARSQMEHQVWQRIASSYVSDLRIPEDDLLDPQKFAKAYSQAIRPQLEIARSLGFVSGWRWGKN